MLPTSDAKRVLHRVPAFDEIGGEVFGAAIAIEPGNRSARRVEPGARFASFRRTHRTIRRSPATALPRMKLSASWVGMRIPV